MYREGESRCYLFHQDLIAECALGIDGRREEGYYSCTCPSWRNQNDKERLRTCPHLKDLLGKDYEEARIRLERSTSPTVIPKGRGLAKRKTSTTAALDSDLFPTSQSQEKKAKIMYQDFNERVNHGPRDLNGGVSTEAFLIHYRDTS